MSVQEQSPFITLTDISKKYEYDGISVNILTRAAISIHKGQFIIVLGPSGSGKTTVLNLLGSLDQNYEGTIEVDGLMLNEMSSEELTNYRREKVGFVFQFFNLLPTLTVEENVKAGIEVLPWDRDKINTLTREFLGEVGMLEKAKKFPSQLSGGEQQRVSIARALAKHPQLLLADEPTGNLDEENSIRIMKLLKNINKTKGITIVLVTHNINFCQYADRVIEIHNKTIRDSVRGPIQ